MQEKQTDKKLKEALRAEAALNQNEENLRALLDAISESVLMIEADGTTLVANQTVAKRLNTTVEKLIGQNIFQHVSPDVARRRKKYAQQVLQTGQALQFEDKRDNQNMINSISPVFDSHGRVARLAIFGHDITEQKRFEEELRKSEQRFQALIEKAVDLIAIINAEGVIQFVSPPVEKMLGYRPEEMVGKNILDWLNPDDFPDVQKALVSRSQTPGTAPNSLSVRARHKNGSWRILESLGTNLMAEPAIQGIVLNIRDITERKRAEEQVLESEERFSKLFHSSPNAMVLVRASDGIAVEVNDPWTKLLGYSRKESLGQTGLDLNLYMDLRERQQITETMQAQGEIRAFGLRLRRKDGAERHLNVSGESLEIDHQLCYLYILEDITEQKRVEEALRESEEKWRALVENSPDFIALYDDEGRFLFLNHYAEGFSVKETLGRSFKDFILPDSLPIFQEKFQDCLKTLDTQKFEHQAPGDHGEPRIYEEVFVPIPQENGRVNIMAVARDVTEQKQTEALLQKSSQQIKLLYEASQALNRTLNPEELYQTLTRFIAKILPADGLFISAYEHKTGLIRCAFAADQHLQALDVSNFPPIPLEPEGQGTQSQVIRSGRPWLLNDYQTQVKTAQTRYYVTDDGQVVTPDSVPADEDITRSALILPIILEGEVTGVLQIHSYRLNAYSQEDLELAEALAAQFSAASNNALLYQKAQSEIAERKQAEAALRSSEASIRSIYRSMDEMLALHEIVYDPSGKAIDYRIVDCNTAFSVITGIPEKRAIGALASQLYGTGEAPFLEAYAQVAETGETIHFEVSFPPLKKDFSISAFSPEKGHFATISSDITRRKAAEAEISRHLSELEVLYENGLAISQLLEPRQIGQKLIETLSKKLDWHHASIRVIHPQTGRLELLAYGHPGFNKTEIEVEIARLNKLVTDSGKGLSGWVTKHGKPARCAQVKKNRHYLETYPGIQSGLYVPIQVGGRTIGSIAVESEQENAFSEQDQRLLTTIASQAAISIQNAQLFLIAQQELAARKQAEQALIEAHAELEQRVVERTAEVQDLYNNAPCGYHSLDANGNFAHINKTESNWLGYANKDIVGHPVKDFMSESSQALFAEIFPLFKKSGVLKDQELDFVRRDGTILPLLINATAIYDQYGRYKMSRSTTLDITQRKLFETALRESEVRLRQNRDELSAANTALEKAARMKDEFLASMSHELRTPLTGILGLSEALQLSTYGDLSEKQLKALKNIENSGRHLLELINDILDLSKIEAGKFEVHLEQCSLTDVCRASLQLAKGMAQQKHQEVSFSMNPDSIYLYADARRLKQMLVNLLSNAVKFTPDGGSIGLEILGNASEQRLRLTVWDTGIGIKVEDMKNLFKPFVQLDSSLSRQYSGTGLGLSLVQRMAELQGGSVEVESALGQGSQFTIILPWPNQDEQSAETSSGKATDEGPSQPTPAKETGQGESPALILVADDNEDILGLLSDFLEVEHFKVVKTRSGIELLERAPEIHPDILLVDIQMPGMDGLETIHRIRAHPDAQVAAVPIIALTALAMPGDRERCLAAGASDYLSKPLQLEKLITVIREILR